MRNPQSLGCHRGSERFAQSNRFDLELIGVLPISYQLSLAHVVLRSSDVISYLMYVKPWQGHHYASQCSGSFYSADRFLWGRTFRSNDEIDFREIDLPVLT